MRIQQIELFQIDIPIKEPKTFPNGVYAAFDDTVVRITTDTGLQGWAEICPIASTYQPEHAEGVRASLKQIAPGLIGLDPTQTGVINDRMGDWLMGSVNAKSALDIACWDLVGKAHKKPLFQMIGGARQPHARGYCAVELNDLDQVEKDMTRYRAKGYRHFQIKSKTSDLDMVEARLRRAMKDRQPGDIFAADANKAWRPHEAIRVLNRTGDLDFYVEQPCLTYEECLSVRRRVRQPMVLDECITDPKMALRALGDDAFDGIGCKITRVGGITGTMLIRNMCALAGKFLTIDDMWGADLSAAAQCHLAVSSPASVCLASYISTDFSDLRYDLEAPAFADGSIAPNHKPGLGVEPSLEALGEPVWTTP